MSTATAVPTATATAPASATPAASGWSVPVVISEERFYEFVAVAVDSAGYVHVAASDSAVHYLTNRSGTWTRTRVARPPSGGADREPSIAVDDDGSLWIAFERWSSWDPCSDVCEGDEETTLEGVQLMTNVSGDWAIAHAVDDAVAPTVVAGSGSVFLTALVTAINEEWELQLASDTSGAWVSSAVDRGPDLVGGSIAVGTDGSVHVTYRRAGELVYGHAPAVGQPFVLATVPGFVDVYRAFIGVDSTGQPHLALTAWSGQQTGVFYVSLTRNGWTQPQPVAQHSARAIAVSAQGDVHILVWNFAEEEAEDDDLMLWEEVWHWSSGSAEAVRVGRTVGYELGPGTQMALAVDPSGRPHVAFTHFGDSDLGLGHAVGPAD